MTTRSIGAAYIVVGLFWAGLSFVADTMGFGREVMRVFAGSVGLGLVLGGLCLRRGGIGGATRL